MILIDTQIKNISKLTHKITLFETENKIFHIINYFFNKRKRLKKSIYKLNNYLMH